MHAIKQQLLLVLRNK